MIGLCHYLLKESVTERPRDGHKVTTPLLEACPVTEIKEGVLVMLVVWLLVLMVVVVVVEMVVLKAAVLTMVPGGGPRVCWL